MGVEGACRPRPCRRGVQVQQSRDHGRARHEAEVTRRLRCHVTHDRTDRHQRRQTVLGDSDHREQTVVVVVGRQRSRVAEPRREVRGVRRRGDAGEAHRQVVHRFEEPRGRGDEFGLAIHHVEHLSDGVTSGRDGCARRFLDEMAQLDRVVALDRAAESSAREGSAPGIHPGEARTGRHAIGIHGHGRRVLARHRHDFDALTRHAVVFEETARRRGDDRPPFVGILGGRATGTQGRRDHVDLVRDDLAVEGDESHFGATGPQVDAETEVRDHGAGMAAWWSIMSAMKNLMTPSISSVIPPATPP